MVSELIVAVGTRFFHALISRIGKRWWWIPALLLLLAPINSRGEDASYDLGEFLAPRCATKMPVMISA